MFDTTGNRVNDVITVNIQNESLDKSVTIYGLFNQTGHRVTIQHGLLIESYLKSPG